MVKQAPLENKDFLDRKEHPEPEGSVVQQVSLVIEVQMVHQDHPELQVQEACKETRDRLELPVNQAHQVHKDYQADQDRLGQLGFQVREALKENEVHLVQPA